MKSVLFKPHHDKAIQKLVTDQTDARYG